MGGPKALMFVGGRRWIDVQRKRLAGIPIEVTWVVSPEVRDAIRDWSYDPRPASVVIGDSTAPMFASLLLGLGAAVAESAGTGHSAQKGGGAFVLPVDVPAPRALVWEALAQTREVAAPMFNGRRGHPVFLPWGRVGTLLATGGVEEGGAGDGEPRLDRLVDKEATVVSVDDRDITINLNRPADVQAWLESRTAPRDRASGGGAG